MAVSMSVGRPSDSTGSACPCRVNDPSCSITAMRGSWGRARQRIGRSRRRGRRRSVDRSARSEPPVSLTSRDDFCRAHDTVQVACALTRLRLLPESPKGVKDGEADEEEEGGGLDIIGIPDREPVVGLGQEEVEPGRAGQRREDSGDTISVAATATTMRTNVRAWVTA